MAVATPSILTQTAKPTNTLCRRPFPTRTVRFCSDIPVDRPTSYLGEEKSADKADENKSDDQDTTAAFLQEIHRSVKEHIFCHHEGGTAVLLLGVSGGCDSVALMHALCQLLPLAEPCGDGRPRRRFLDTFCEFHVVHFDHCLRGEQSDQDRVFVEELCRTLQVPCHVFRWDDDDKESLGRFSQDHARVWRRSSMVRLLQQLVLDTADPQERRSGVLLTAHHLDDSNESLLLKLLRGVHISNLSGMLPCQDISAEDRSQASPARLVRPMLGLTKAQAKAFLVQQELPWREDASNASSKYLRNRVRNELVPLLTDLVGGDSSILQKRLDNLSEQSQSLNEDLSKRVDAFLSHHVIDDDIFLVDENPLDLVGRQALHQWIQCRTDDFPVSYSQLMRVCQQLEDHPQTRQWTLQIGGCWNIRRNGNTLTCIEQGSPAKTEGPVRTDGVANNNGRVLEWSFLPMNEWAGNGGKQDASDGFLHILLPSADSSARFELSTVESWPLTLIPPWRDNPVKVRSFLRGQKVPLHRRDLASVVVRTDGDIPTLVAVYVETTGQWVVNSRFCDTTLRGSTSSVCLDMTRAMS